MKFQTGGPPRFTHQRRGLAKMLSTGGQTALLFDPGTGKTAVVLDYASLLALKATSGEARILVVCPLAAVDTWVTQAELFLSPQVHYWAEALGGSLIERGEALASRGGQPYRKTKPKKAAHPRAAHYQRSVMLSFRASQNRIRPMTPSEGPEGLGDDKPRVVLEILNIDTLMSRARKGSRTIADYLVESIHRYGPDLVVVDESHKIKGAMSNSSRLLARVVPFVPRRMLLTGTVMPHSPLDVFGQWRFLDPHAFGSVSAAGVAQEATWEGFKSRFVQMGGFMGYQVKGFVNLDEMQRIMSRKAVVVRKNEALDLPPTTDVIVPVNLSDAEKAAYREMRTMLQIQFSDGTTATSANKLSQMMRLRQITSGHLPDDLGQLRVVGDSKAQVIRSIVNDTLLGESRVVVFCLFSHEIATLSALLAEKDTEIMRIQGGTPPEDRMEMRRRFGDPSIPQRMVMVAQIKTMSLAVNELVTASHAVFGSLSQQRDDLVQARDRLDRIGQKLPVTFWYCLAPHTVDEVIWNVHQERSNLESAMLRHIKGEEEIAA